MSYELKTFFDQDTFTLTYVVSDPKTKDAIVIDSVMNFDSASGKYSYESVEEVDQYIREGDFNLRYILETHAHADHLTGAQEIQRRYPNAKVGIGKNITQVQDLFSGVYNLKGFPATGEQFDVLLNEKENLNAGSIEVRTIFTPGHTPACSSYLIGDMAFTGDALFMPDFGTGRCDFPAGSAEDLYHSVHEKLYKLPDETRVLVGHDYMPGGRELKYESTIGEQKKSNKQLREETSREEFVNFRQERDAQLAAPRLLLPSIQVNIRAGCLPEIEDNGTSYLKIPLKKKSE